MAGVLFQKWVLERTFEKLRRIFNAVLLDLPVVKESVAKAVSKGQIRDLTDESSAAQHSEKNGKWRKQSRLVLACDVIEVD